MVVSIAIFVMSVLSKNIEDSRILGVHNVITPTALPTAKPTSLPTVKPTVRPTIEPTPFTGCKVNGIAVSNPSLCCSQYAVYVWSSYVCGELKPTIGASSVVEFTPIVTPTIKPTICKVGSLDIACVDSNGWNCKWYRNENCSWTCNQNCIAPKRCESGKLGKSCTNAAGQRCQEYQNSDCSIGCTQNCKAKADFTSYNNSVVAKTFNVVAAVLSIGSCKVGVDYNSDGVVNSMDFVFCNSNKPWIVKSFDAVVTAVNEGAPVWFDWIVSKMIRN